MKPIKLTTHSTIESYDGKEIIVGTFWHIEPNTTGGSTIHFGIDYWIMVKETPEQIWKMLQEEEDSISSIFPSSKFFGVGNR